MTLTTVLRSKGAFNPLGCLALSLALSACGGGKTSSAEAPQVAPAQGSATSANPLPSGAQTQAMLKKGAELNSAELTRAAAETAGQPVTQTGKKGTTKAATSATLVTVWRFFNTRTLAHFYTANEGEKEAVLASVPTFKLDGAAFYASSVSDTGLSPVHRFYNTQTGVHFYTISEDEKTMVMASLPQFNYEGVAYYASQVAGNQFIPLYRLYQLSKGFHFYSNSAGERDTVVNTLPQYRYEGIGYYVFNTLTLPHTGVTDQQCFQAGVGPLVACSSTGAIAFNSQQDGHRAAINPMSYSEMPNASGGNYARTECVKDNVTGLIWEGKTASGLRAGSNDYTNYDDPTQPQIGITAGHYVNPTQAEIADASNSVGYKNYVNSIALCGYADWRLPTPEELHSIVDYGNNMFINTDWFPNIPQDYLKREFWTSTAEVGINGFGIYVRFSDVLATIGGSVRNIPGHVRLVRGGG